MCDTDDLTSKIWHLQGPQGQNVIIVPAKLETPGKTENTCKWCCVVLGSIIEIPLLLVALYFTVVIIFRLVTYGLPVTYSERQRIIILIVSGLIPFALAGLVLLFIILLKRRIRKGQREKIKRFMYKDPEDEDDPEAIGRRNHPPNTPAEDHDMAALDRGSPALRTLETDM